MSRIFPCGPRARWLCVAFAIWLTWLSLICPAAEAPFFHFQTNDVIAFAGGEDVVEMQRNGYLELLLTAALPNHKLRFRNLAFEGDTVFEQHRQLNFPPWEKQLERVGATVVIAQFGQAESLQGTKGLPGFTEAYSKLLSRFTNGNRRLVLLAPTSFTKPPGVAVDLNPRNADLEQYVAAVRALADEPTTPFVDPFHLTRTPPSMPSSVVTRDGLHLSHQGHSFFARAIAIDLLGLHSRVYVLRHDAYTGVLSDSGLERLRQLILEKNRLWFDYWRPQNWAFLNGDRTEQPSSRDHRDMKKRWFPEEMEKFLPLIEAKEKEIWKLAAELK